MRFVKKMLSKIGLKRKGITPVIAIVLLLMMTVAAAGMAYVWIMGLQEGIAEDTDQDINRLQDEKNTRLQIVSVYNDTATGELNFIFKNSGTHVFTPEEVAGIKIYIDGQLKPMPTTPCQITSQGTTCTYDSTTSNTLFPSLPGMAGAVEIKVEPPFGTGDTHICSIPSTGTHKTC